MVIKCKNSHTFAHSHPPHS